MMKLTLISLTAAMALLAQPAATSYKALKFPPLREVPAPKVESVTLSNGMKVFLLEDHELPLVTGTALVRTGNLFDPKDKVGLAGITGSLIRSGGTKTKTSEQLDETLENIAARVETGIGETSGFVSFNTLAEHLDPVLAVFKDVLTNPEFRQNKLDLLKTQTRSGISRRNDDAGSIADREFAAIIYGKDNSYGWEQEYVHVDAIQRADVQAFYQRYFFPENIILSVYGDFNAAQMKQKLEALLSDWKVKQAAVPAFPSVSAKTAPGVNVAKKEDVTQTFFKVGHIGGKLNDKDYPALNVMANILGEPGGFSSRLVQSVRVKNGLAYSINSIWGANFNHPGLFAIEGSTKVESTAKTLQLIQEEISKIRNLEVTDAELTTAKNVILNSFVFTVDRPSKTLNRMVTYEYQGYPKDFLAQYQKAISAVTKADIKRVAAQYLKPENFTYLLVGNPDKFDDKSMKSLGLPVKDVDLTIPEPKKEKAAATGESKAAGRALLDRIVTAAGGMAKIAAVKDYTQTVSATVGPMKADQKNQQILPGAFRQETTLPFGKIISFFDGKTGWIKAPQGEMPVAGPLLAQMKQQAFTEYLSLLKSNQTAGRDVNLAAPGVVEISESGISVRITVDQTTGLPAKLSMDVVGPQGPALTEYVLSDFKEVAGVKMPHKIEVSQGGVKASDIAISAITVNDGLKLEDLGKKP